MPKANAVIVFFILLLSSLFSLMYNLNYYEDKYEKYNIYEKIPRENAIAATNNIFNFFKSKTDLDKAFFNNNEISHLTDVKILIAATKILYYLCLALFWIFLIGSYILKRKDFTKYFANTLFYSGILSIVIILLLSLTYFFSGFDFLFTKFHEIFFVGNYSFDPAVSNMKTLFPDAFFFDISFSIIKITFFKGIALLISGLFLRKIYKREISKKRNGKPTNTRLPKKRRSTRLH